jgi:hypothetical protein
MECSQREPLTAKARGAISEYALYRCKDLRIAGLLIKYTLDAERMKRMALYSYLERHGFKWTGRYWIKTEKANAKKSVL